jgi:hypothetical protein
MPDGPGTDAGEAGEFSDPQASRRRLDAATRSNGAPSCLRQPAGVDGHFVPARIVLLS